MLQGKGVHMKTPQGIFKRVKLWLKNLHISQLYSYEHTGNKRQTVFLDWDDEIQSFVRFCHHHAPQRFWYH